MNRFLPPLPATLLLASGLAAFGATGAHAQAQATFGDWSVACDNTRICRAIGFAGEAGGGWIRVDRDASANAPAMMRIVIDVETQDKELPVALKFDDASVANPLGERLTVKQGEDGRFGVETRRPRRLVSCRPCARLAS